MGQEFQAFSRVSQLDDDKSANKSSHRRHDDSMDDLENVNIEYQIMNRRVTCLSEIRDLFRNELDVIKAKRAEAVSKVKAIRVIKKLVQHASDCHLRYQFLEETNGNQADLHSKFAKKSHRTNKNRKKVQLLPWKPLKKLV
jgi:hypothetical protein